MFANQPMALRQEIAIVMDHRPPDLDGNIRDNAPPEQTTLSISRLRLSLRCIHPATACQDRGDKDSNMDDVWVVMFFFLFFGILLHDRIV